jgi:hypothetical protein
MKKPPTKIKRVTHELIHGPLDFITAQQKANDRSLHSTVSQIQRDYGVQVYRKRISRPGFMGLPVSCCEYRILPDQHEKAHKAMEFMR